MMHKLSALLLTAAAGGLLWLAPADRRAATAADAESTTSWTSIKGQLVYGGPTPPAQQPLNVSKDQEHCLANGHKVLNEEWVVDAGTKGVKNVFVWLAPKPGAGPLPIHPSLQAVPTAAVTVDQPQCAFEPHVVALREGQDLIVKNSAPVAHNVAWTGSKLKNPGNNQTVPAGKSLTLTPKLKADRLPVKIACNIHPWMNGWVRIFDHPYFAITDAKGDFEIKNAPVGDFVLFIWHEGAGWRGGVKGRDGQPVTLKAGPVNDLGKLDIKPSD